MDRDRWHKFFKVRTFLWAKWRANNTCNKSFGNQFSVKSPSISSIFGCLAVEAPKLDNTSEALIQFVGFFLVPYLPMSWVVALTSTSVEINASTILMVDCQVKIGPVRKESVKCDVSMKIDLSTRVGFFVLTSRFLKYPLPWTHLSVSS